jgi:MFS family permease
VTSLASRARGIQQNRPLIDQGTHITKRQWLMLLVMCFTVLLISLDQTVLNVALPTLVKELHPSSSGLQWIADSYTLTNAVLLLFGGALGDRFGRRRLFLVGVAIFGGGSLGCALVHSTGPLIGARAVMGLGAAFLMPATLSIIAATFSGHRRARAIGIWAGVGGIGAAAGPLLGGWLLQHFWWGSVFLINVPVAVLALLGGLFAVSESRASDRPSLDPVGVVLSSLGLTALTYGFIVSSTDGWGSATVVGALASAIALLSVFVLWDRRRSKPFLDLRLFANRTFSSALGAVTAVFFAMFGVSYLVSQYIQFVQGADPFGVGIRFLPSADHHAGGHDPRHRRLGDVVHVDGRIGILDRWHRLRARGVRHGFGDCSSIQCHRGHIAGRQGGSRFGTSRHGATSRRFIRSRDRRELGRRRLPLGDPQGIRWAVAPRSGRSAAGRREPDR